MMKNTIPTLLLQSHRCHFQRTRLKIYVAVVASNDTCRQQSSFIDQPVVMRRVHRVILRKSRIWRPPLASFQSCSIQAALMDQWTWRPHGRQSQSSRVCRTRMPPNFSKEPPFYDFSHVAAEAHDCRARAIQPPAFRQCCQCDAFSCCVRSWCPSRPHDSHIVPLDSSGDRVWFTHD